MKGLKRQLALGAAAVLLAQQEWNATQRILRRLAVIAVAFGALGAALAVFGQTTTARLMGRPSDTNQTFLISQRAYLGGPGVQEGWYSFARVAFRCTEGLPHFALWAAPVAARPNEAIDVRMTFDPGEAWESSERFALANNGGEFFVELNGTWILDKFLEHDSVHVVSPHSVERGYSPHPGLFRPHEFTLNLRHRVSGESILEHLRTFRDECALKRKTGWRDAPEWASDAGEAVSAISTLYGRPGGDQLAEIVELVELEDGRRVRRNLAGFRCWRGRSYFFMLPPEGEMHPDFSMPDRDAHYWVSFDGLSPERYTFSREGGGRLVLLNAIRLVDGMTHHDQVIITPDSRWWNTQMAGWFWARQMHTLNLSLVDIQEDLHEFRRRCVKHGDRLGPYSDAQDGED